MFDLFKAKLYFKNLGDLLNKRKVVAHGAMNLSMAYSVGFIFNVDNTSEISAVGQMAGKLRGQGKVVELLGYCKNAKIVSKFDFPVFDKSTINSHFFPSDDDVDRFINKKFDILINASSEVMLPLDYVAALSHSTCRVGVYNKDHEHSYELMIHSDTNINPFQFLEQVEHFLNKIKLE
jgi:hypothetical protein